MIVWGGFSKQPNVNLNTGGKYLRCSANSDSESNSYAYAYAYAYSYAKSIPYANANSYEPTSTPTATATASFANSDGHGNTDSYSYGYPNANADCNTNPDSHSTLMLRKCRPPINADGTSVFNVRRGVVPVTVHSDPRRCCDLRVAVSNYRCRPERTGG